MIYHHKCIIVKICIFQTTDIWYIWNKNWIMKSKINKIIITIKNKHSAQQSIELDRKITKNTEELKKTINLQDLINIYKIRHPQTIECIAVVNVKISYSSWIAYGVKTQQIKLHTVHFQVGKKNQILKANKIISK